MCSTGNFSYIPLRVRRFREVDVVDRLDHILSREDAATKPAPIETTKGVCATLDPVEFNVDFAFGALHADADVHDVAVFVFALAADIGFELFLPIGLGLSA